MAGTLKCRVFALGLSCESPGGLQAAVERKKDTRRSQRENKRTKMGCERGKKSAKFCAVRRRGSRAGCPGQGVWDSTLHHTPHTLQSHHHQPPPPYTPHTPHTPHPTPLHPNPTPPHTGPKWVWVKNRWSPSRPGPKSVWASVGHPEQPSISWPTACTSCLHGGLGSLRNWAGSLPWC